jgi:hypothetical protein
MSCVKQEPEDPLAKILRSLPHPYREVVSDHKKYGLQVLYTQINRNEDNQPIFRTWPFEADSDIYFYPASTVKLPVALLALEKINDLSLPGLSKASVMLTDSVFSGQTKAWYDSTALSLRPSIEHYIKKIFLVSDNDAFNRLYEFLGQEYIHEKLSSKGFINTGIVHRLSVFLSPEENRHTNPVRFFDADTLIYAEPEKVAPVFFKDREEIELGKGYLVGDSLVEQPMDFTRKNFMSLKDLHNMLIEVVFPGILTGTPLFNLSGEDYHFLYRYMSMFPGESVDPDYGEMYNDNYCKFLMFGDHEEPIPKQIRLFNKVGVAYGFVIDAAYIVDFERKIEFFLSAVMDVNLNQIYMDDHYAYDSLGYPFFAELGRATYRYELNRERSYRPELKRFKFEY